MTDLQTCAIVKFYPADKYQFQVDQVDTRDSKQNLVVVASSLLTFNSYLPREWFYTLHPYTQYKKKQILVQILFYHPAMPAKIIQGTTKFSRIRVILLELSDERFNTAWSEHRDLRTPM